MGNKELKNEKNQSYSDPGDFWALSNQILELAANGYPRAQFLNDVTQLLIRFSGCCIIGLAFWDGGRQFFCRASQTPEQDFRFKEIPFPKGRDDTIAWSSSKNGAIELLCRDIINKHFNPSLQHFTKNGSFWSGETDKLSIPNLHPSDSDKELGINIHKDSKSIAIIPIDVGQERVGLLEMRSRAYDFFAERQIILFEQMARTIGNALTHRRLHVALRERVKELTCLYGISKLVQQPGISLDYILQETVKLLPPAWLYPEISSAQIALDSQVYITSGFGKAVHKMKADIVVNKKNRGYVEIRYLAERPMLDDGPFLREERHLIDTIAQELSIIVEQMQVEDEKLKLQEQLRHADRLATIGQLVAGVTHELNEPLANILGFAQLATKAPGLADQVEQDIGKIVDAALHAREVIKKLLMSAKDTPLVKNRINLNDLIEDGLYFLKSRCIKSGIELVSNLSKELPNIVADRSQLMQVLTNLVVNAAQAMPHGGRLTISTTIDIGHVLLTIEDTGTGMTDEVQKKIFDPFFTTKDADQGTGLGLPIVHGIITSHGGEIKVESEVGIGTKFIIRLPIETSVDLEESDNA